MTTGSDIPHSSSLSGGVPCPQCGRPIQFSVQFLIQSRAVQCPACGLKLEIDAQQSAAALSALRKFNAEIESIQQDRDPQMPAGGG